MPRGHRVPGPRKVELSPSPLEPVGPWLLSPRVDVEAQSMKRFIFKTLPERNCVFTVLCILPTPKKGGPSKCFLVNSRLVLTWRSCRHSTV